MTNTPTVAIAEARANSKGGPTFGVGECLQRVRECYGVPAKYPSAAQAWAHTTKRHSAAVSIDIPAGVPVWWTGGTHGYGHVAISAGKGECWSTDIKRPGRFDLCRIADINKQWGLTLVGWSQDINGVTVYEEPPMKPNPAHKPSRGKGIDAVIARLMKARAYNARLNTGRAKVKVKQIDAALAALKKIPAL